MSRSASTATSAPAAPGPELVSVRATRVRLVNRGAPRRKLGTILRIRLASRAAIEVSVYGPAPGCERVGAYSVRGRRGVNAVRFFGRLNGKALEPGVYTLGVRALSGAKRSDVKAVTV